MRAWYDCSATANNDHRLFGYAGLLQKLQRFGVFVMIVAKLFLTIAILCVTSHAMAQQQIPLPSTPQQSQLPEWAYAVGRIEMLDMKGYAGSCTYFAHDKKFGYVITNRHVGGGGRRCRVTFKNGLVHEAVFSWAVPGADAVVFRMAIPHSIDPLSLATREQMPKRGQTVYLAGYGIDRAVRVPKLTIWRASWIGHVGVSQIASDTNTISGDSGGATVFDGRLVGINWGGPLEYKDGPMIHSQSVASDYVLLQLNKNECGPGQYCPPQRRMPRPRRPRRPSPGTIDVPVAPEIPVVPEIPLVPDPPAIAAKGDKGDKGDRGDKGDKGEAATLDVQKLADEIVRNLPPIMLQLSDGDDTTPDEYITGQLGDTLILPPQMLRIRDGDKTFLIEEALGNAIRISVEDIIGVRAEPKG